MSDDALERLKKRQRPSVAARDASLSNSSQDISTSGYQDIKVSSNQDIPDSKSQDIPASSSQDTSTSGYQDTKVSTHPELKTKQSTIRLEAELSERLSEVCKANGISREVLIEALFEHYEADPQVWQAILVLAKAKGEQRMQIANMKRAQSMMQRFS